METRLLSISSTTISSVIRVGLHCHARFGLKIRVTHFLSRIVTNRGYTVTGCHAENGLKKRVGVSHFRVTLSQLSQKEKKIQNNLN